MMVLDTSALVAVLSAEADGDACNARIAAEEHLLLSAASYLEAAIVIDARFGQEGVHDLRFYLHEAGIEIVPFDRDQADIARRAYGRYGKGRHPAGLNFGDCFAYALAKVRSAPLLYTGNDFAQTDVTNAR